MSRLKAVMRVVAVSIVMSVTMTTHAEPKPVATKKDLVGCYERIYFSPEVAQQMNPIEYWSQPYQWFCFKKDGTLDSVMLPYYQRQTARSLERSFKRTPANAEYDVITKGMIQTKDIHTQELSYWQVTLLDKAMTTSDGTFIPKNTLLMALINPANDTIIYWRYLKKLK